MKSINPATGELLRDWPEHDETEVLRRLELAEQTFHSWSRTSYEERARLLKGVARVLREDLTGWAKQMTEEMGKTLAAAEAETEKCAWVCDHYAEAAARYLAPEPVKTDASESFVRFDPLGPILAVMPWNFPFWQVFRFAAPALMAGNVGLLKHASNVPGCAVAIEEVFRRAGLPEGCFTTLLIGAKAVDRVLESPVVRAVTLTGSDPAGRAIGAKAGSLLKKTVLELGGSDPFIVLYDADPREAARIAARARCINNGQSCIAAKRFIVEEAIADRFEEHFTAEMAGFKVGDPMDRTTDVGPLAREDLLQDLHAQVQRSLSEGAKLRTGGRRLDRRGYFYAPTVLDHVRPGMTVFDDETFGPVAAVVRARDAEDALRLANQSKFGLGASLWTANAERAKDLAGRLETGSVFVNGMVKSDPRLPFGGIKTSGYGRELSHFGIREFVNVKTVWIR
ncbi:MAG: NAD-dependent succinate-semialdehyde dehydrogenase [Deltaproteobacteria bacterium]|nr:NAD-dependent succinate-semialdehyde dehydrogenase [Deltaproteobacteria bacterium]